MPRPVCLVLPSPSVYSAIRIFPQIDSRRIDFVRTRSIIADRARESGTLRCEARSAHSGLPSLTALFMPTAAMAGMGWVVHKVGREGQSRDSRRGLTSDASGNVALFVLRRGPFSIPLPIRERRAKGHSLRPGPAKVPIPSSKQIWPLRKPSVHQIRTIPRQLWHPCPCVLRRLRFRGMDFGWPVGPRSDGRQY